MAQKTNLNVSPYFDDFNEDNIGAKDKNYYKVLFNPGKPIQARELNNLQSILQNQIESFGSHIFKEGSVVIPGNVVFDDGFTAVKINPQQYGVDISTYISGFINKTIVGQISGVKASVQLIQSSNTEVEYTTLYIKYLTGDSNFEIKPFLDNEPLFCEETISGISAGTPFATTILSNATSTGSAASIGEGIFYIRGTFVRVAQQTIILDYYTNTPSYRVGLKVDERIVTAKDDSNLYDNAKGFTNYSAPGADRFQISLILSKKPLDDLNDTDFIELLRVRDGAIKKIEQSSQYAIIKDYMAQRTYDESGNYVVDSFGISLNNSLNDRLGNDGIFFDNEKTDQRNTPSDDLMCLKVSPGKAYVRGYDISKTSAEIIDVEKPRTTQSVSSDNIPFEMGNLIRVNNVSGAPKQKQEIYLHNLRKNSTLVSAGTTVGVARVYNFNLTDSAYTGASTNWDLYLYDIQTYTELTLNESLSSSQLPKTSFIKGKSSGASGYAVSAGAGTSIISLRQTSGNFSVGEGISINSVDLYPRSIKSIRVFSVDDVKSLHQPTSISGFATAFLADSNLERVFKFGEVSITSNSGGISTATIVSPNTFSGIKSDTIIRYSIPGASTEVYNRVLSVNPTLSTLTLAAVNSVTGVCDGSLPSIASTITSYSVGIPQIRNPEKGFLYANLSNLNVSSVDLSASILSFSAQTNSSYSESVSPAGQITVNTGVFNLGINSTTAKFEAFDEERYSIFYEDGTIEKLTSDKVELQSNATQVTFSNLIGGTVKLINATFVKNGVQSKVKQFERSKTINITFSKNSQSGVGVNTSVSDGLTYNQYYGLRVQDEEISLNYPDVVKIIAIYESLDTSSPTLDQILFNSVANVSNNSIIGENIIGSSSGAVARIVTKPSTDTLGVVYLNSNRFSSAELVSFEESNIKTEIVQITSGKYQNVTNKFILDKGQKEQYYDYSKIIRKSGESSPSRQLLIIFDYYTVPSNDTGDVFTVNSYSQERYLSDIPNIDNTPLRASDTLDFRPRVQPFTSSSKSPFDFDSRAFGAEPKLMVSPNESTLIGYQFYLGRIDKVYLDRFGIVTVFKGNPSVDPKAPSIPNDVMEIAEISLPAYLFNPKDASISLIDNRRYTMRDIGKIEDRVENLEKVTSLSLLEVNTQTLQIRDARGINRFKSGFFVDDFKNEDLINKQLSSIEVDTTNNELRPIISKNSLNLKLVPEQSTTDENFDSEVDFSLLDSNVQKTGDSITLKYEEVSWIEQTFATDLENVNPFHILSYNGTITLNPNSDSWIRTIRREDINIKLKSASIRVRNTGRYRLLSDKIEVKTVDNVISSGAEEYMRSRNVEFNVVNLSPNTQYYQFLDSTSGVDFIPKLIEISPDSTLQNYGASSAFIVGETVVGTFEGQNIISFRVSQSDHKLGPFNSATTTYAQNPYSPSETIPSSYSSSSKILNVDTSSLSNLSQGLYFGYINKGTKLVGQTSGSVAYVKDLKLITDNSGYLCGSFFLKNPLSSPPPLVRINTGSKSFKITSSSSNEIPLPGDKSISSAETTYISQGRWEERQRTITSQRVVRYEDPLAQSFIVSGTTDADAAKGSKPTEDANGAYLTAVDVYFGKKDPGNAPITCEIRSVEFGTPTLDVFGKVTYTPDQINVSSDATVPTKFVFPEPIYLEPNKQYAVVLLAPSSINYYVWTAIMGNSTVETRNLPEGARIPYTTQFAIGRLYKSQNGGEWTPSDMQDMKFKLYKSKFTSASGSVIFNNPTLNESNGYVPTLGSNPITILPKKVSLGITTTTNSNVVNNVLTIGKKVKESTKTYVYGYIVGTGSSVSTVGVTTGGVNYVTDSSVETYNIIGSGKNLTLNITASAGGNITAASPVNRGSGYSVGDVVGIKTSTVSSNSGADARITITNTFNGIDRLYLSNVQGNFTDDGTATIVSYDNDGNQVSMASTYITSITPEGGFYAGNVFKVNHFDHGMYANTNKLTLTDIKSDVEPITLSSKLLQTGVTISVASTTPFGTFEGIAVGGGNTGYVKIGNEIIGYEGIIAGTPGSLTTLTRGVNSTKNEEHDTNQLVYKYELGGVSLLRINKTHDINDSGIDIDNYYVEFDRTLYKNRNADAASVPQLSFNSESSCGGELVTSTENIQFDTIIPHAAVFNPTTPTNVSAQIRTVSGTSVNGSETSFADQGYEEVGLEKENKLSSTRIVCSKINEETYLTALPSNKSFTLKLNLSTTDSNVSPVIKWKNTSVELLSSRLNSPVSDYVNNNSVNSVINDPHAAIYVSNTVQLANPADTLKVLVNAYKPSSSDFRVLYSLIRPDSSEVTQSFELFPGYDNLLSDRDSDGYQKIRDVSQNSGLPDVFVPDSLDGEFLEYEFTAPNVGQFVGYTIKIVMSGTDQSKAPRFKDLRSIAVT